MSKEYHIKLNGELIPVTEDIYRAYQQPKWREIKRAKTRAKKEISLDASLEDGHFMQLDSKQALIDEIAMDKLILDELFSALAELTDDERFLIDHLFYKEQSERELARKTGMPRNTIAYRKNKILNKLKKIIEKI